MARSQIIEISTDIQTDNGTVLWSFVQGEQLEFPVTLNFLDNIWGGYVYEAVVVEAENVEGSDGIPTTINPTNPVKTTLTVRIPVNAGVWSAVTPYSREDVVSYNGNYYKLKSGADRVSATTPDLDVNYWELYVPNKVYIQFPKELSVAPAYAVQPTAASSIRGFFELRVTEPDGSIYKRTWKPLRGVVELLFSPTALVPDL